MPGDRTSKAVDTAGHRGAKPRGWASSAVRATGNRLGSSGRLQGAYTAAGGLRTYRGWAERWTEGAAGSELALAL